MDLILKKDHGKISIQNHYSYITQKHISTGNYGKIELVKERLSKEHYISKTANKLEFNSIIHREETVLREIKSEYVVNYIDSYTNKSGYRTLILEYFPRDLRDIIASYDYNSSFSESKIENGEYIFHKLTHFPSTNIDLKKKLLFQIISGINDIHNNNISHNDLKPENILVDDQFNAKICDFGSSFHIMDSNQELNAVIPTNLAYKSPERLLGTRNPCDLYSSDIWSFGCIAFELLTGMKVYDGNSELDQLINILKIVGTPVKTTTNDSDYKSELDEYFGSLPSIIESGIFIPIYPGNWDILSGFYNNTEYECFIKLIKETLNPYSKKRITAEEILKFDIFSDFM